LSTYFKDPDGDVLTMQATYSLNGGAAVPIPGGIFTQPTAYEIYLVTSSISQIGTYTIALTVSDPYGLTASSSFTITIQNTAPSWASAPPSYTIAKLGSISILLSSYVSDA